MEMPRGNPAPPPLTTTIVTSALLGPFGAIWAHRDATRARALGHPTTNYWAAFWLSWLASSAVVTVLVIVVPLALLLAAGMVADKAHDDPVAGSDSGRVAGGSTPQATVTQSVEQCAWKPVSPEGRPATIKDVGTPPTSVPRSGTEVMTVETSFGAVKVTMDRAKAPCATASYAYLASKHFFDGTKCHRMFPGMLQCGDPSATGTGYRETDGTGGPSYQFAAENLPVDASPPYPAGVVAMANNGQPESNGSQFFFIYQEVALQPDYTVIGQVDAASLGVIRRAAAAGHDGAFEPGPGGGHPKNDIGIKTITVSPA